MKKGLSLSVVGGVVLALIGVGLMINVYSDTLGTGFGNTFCMLHSSITSAFPGNQVPPAGCQQGEDPAYDAVTGLHREDVAGIILSCWQEYESFLSEERLCAGWNVEEIEGGDPIEESDVRPVVEEYCEPVFDDADCWNNKVEFNTVNEGDFVLIYYTYDEDNDEEKVVVE